MTDQVQDREAVERAARAAARTYHGSDAYWGPLGPLWTAVARAALAAVGWDETQAEVKRLREAWAMCRDDVIRLLNDNTVSHVERINGADDLLRLPLLLAETGQPGEGHEPDLSDGTPDSDGKGLPAGLCYRCQRPADAHRPAPVVPDSADVRERFAGYLAEHVREAEGRLHNKYQVRRLADPSGKHSECRYFVLDPQHDEHAATALRAYAEAVRGDLPDLAADLDAWVGIAVVRPTVTGEVHVRQTPYASSSTPWWAEDRPAPSTTTEGA